MDLIENISGDMGQRAECGKAEEIAGALDGVEGSEDRGDELGVVWFLFEENDFLVEMDEFSYIQ